MATGCFLNPALRHQEGATSWCSARQNWGTERALCGPQRAEEMSQKNLRRNSRSFSTRPSISWFRNSKLAGPRRSASKWISWHRKTTPTVYPMRNIWDIKNIGVSHKTNRARMHRCDFEQTSEEQSQKWTVSTENQEKNGQNQSLFNFTKGGTRPLEFLHGGVGIKTGGVHNYLFQNFVVVGSFTADSKSAATNGGCKQYTSHVTFFSFTARKCNDVSHDIDSSVCARHSIHVSCAWVIVCSLFDPHFALFIVSPNLPLLLAENRLLPFPLPCGCPWSKIPVHFANEESSPLANNSPLTRTERSSGWTRPESKEEIAHEVSVVNGQRQWAANGEEVNPRWRIENGSWGDVGDGHGCWTEEKCTEMDELAQENHPYCPSSEEYSRDVRTTGISHWTNQAEMHRWNSDQTSEEQSQSWTVYTANLEKSDLNQFLFINTQGGIRLLPALHVGIGIKNGGAHNFIFEKSFTADCNLLQPTGGMNRTPSHVTFSRICTHV